MTVARAVLLLGNISATKLEARPDRPRLPLSRSEALNADGKGCSRSRGLRFGHQLSKTGT